jgi:glycerophosphoryl diester phosphodiesterase family protein
MSMDLRPLTLGELLDRSFSIYRRHFWLFVGIMSVPSILMLIVSVALQFLQPPNPAVPGAQPDPVEVLSFVVWGGLLMFVGMIAYWISYAVATGAATIAVSQLYRGQQITIAGAYEPVWERAVAIALLLLLIGLRIGGVMLLMGVLLAFFVGGTALMSPTFGPIVGALAGLAVIFVLGLLIFWMSLRYSVAVPTVVLERLGASTAIARSVALTRGHLGRTFVVVLFCVVVAYAAMAIFQGPFLAAAVVAGPEEPTGFWLNLAGVITGSIAGAFTGPLVIIALSVLYYDLRVRKEGLDLQVMISDLGRPRADAPAVLPS